MEDFMTDYGVKILPKSHANERKIVCVEGPVIVGAGPSGLAIAACLKKKGIPSLILERANVFASLWKLKTYDRLHLHLPKEFCQLPHFPFPENYPTFPNRKQFVSYLEDYVKFFELKPKFNHKVVSAEFDKECGIWRVISMVDDEDGESVEIEYVSKFLVVATGENAEAFVPSFEGMDDFGGPMFHTTAYKNGQFFKDKKVLVVGSGNSGMEICLDLANYHAKPSIVIRDSMHVWPREVLGRSTFGISMGLLKWFPLRLVDSFMILISFLVLGNLSKLGIHKPKIGPLTQKMTTGKTPVLDVGTLAKIRDGKVKVVQQGIKRLAYHAVEFLDGTMEKFDAIIFATGFKSNVPYWLKGTNFFSDETGFPMAKSVEGGWKGQEGLYAVGFTKRGLFGVAIDASKTADDIASNWKRNDDDNDDKKC